MKMRTMAAAVILVATLGGCSLWRGGQTAVVVDPVAFAQQAAVDDMAQIAMARIAMERAASTDVRAFAQRVMTDCQARQRELEAVAAKNGIALPDKLEPLDQAKVDRLTAYKGEDFDIAYMDLMITEHQQNFLAFEDAAKAGGALSTFGQTFLPTVRSDLELAKTVDVNVGGALVKQFPG